MPQQPRFGSQRTRTNVRADLGSMDVDIIFLPDGSVKLAVANGASFEDASAKIKELVKILNADGINVKLDGEPEQHRHGPDQQGVRVGGNQIKA